MLRQFSPRRIALFVMLDWPGSLVILAIANAIRDRIGQLPGSTINVLGTFGITVGGTSLDLADGSYMSIMPAEVFILVAIIWPLFFTYIFSVYDSRRNPNLRTELLNVFMAVCVSTMTLAGALYLTYRETPRIAFMIFVGLDLAILLGSRIVVWLYRRKHRPTSNKRRGVIVVGAGEVGQHVVEELNKYAWADVNLLGYADDDPEKQNTLIDGLPVIGSLDQLPEIIVAQQVQDAVIALPLQAHARLVQVCHQLQHLGVHVHVVPDLFSLSFPSASLDGFGGIPVIDLGQPSIHGWQRIVKRIFDTLAVTAGSLVAVPIGIVIAILIKLDSPGPVFYKQVRIGENGHSFTMYKFRSMRVNADTNLHKAYVSRLIQQNLTLQDLGAGANKTLKMEHDPRITRVGCIIRKTSLDELPQIINVLRGEMSLVGPRPPLAYEVDLYKDWHKRRLEAIPGMTGLWQVEGRNRVSFDEMVRIDLEYIEHQSIWLDLKILFLTPLALFTGKGAG